MIAVLDYGIGNLRSAQKALQHVGADARLITVPDDADGAEVWQALLDRSVLVRNCSAWPRLGGCLRVTVGTHEEDDAFLAALAEVLS